MSIVCALGSWIGSDTAATCNGLIIPCAPKWVLGKDWSVGVAGDLRTQTLIAEHPDLLDGSSPADFAGRFRALFKDYDFTSDQTVGPPSFGSDMIVAGEGDVYELCSALSLIKIEGLAAIGSGNRFAIGAAYVAGEAGFEDRSAVACALEAAIKYDAGCNGEPWLWELK